MIDIALWLLTTYLSHDALSEKKVAQTSLFVQEEQAGEAQVLPKMNKQGWYLLKISGYRHIL
ncbi:MAG: hypothetical protein ACPGWR_08850 [Ardenticatenaceae bacterium]